MELQGIFNIILFFIINHIDYQRYNLPRSSDVGILLEVKGTVIRTAMAKTLEYKREYQCTKCKAKCIIEVQLEQMYQFPKPPPCQFQKYIFLIK